MSIDLKSLNRKELEKLLEDVKKTLLSVKARDRRQARKAAERAVAEFGLTLSDLDEDKKPKEKKAKAAKKPGKPAKPKYVNPADPSQTWTGKGRQPNWFRAEVEKGTPSDSMLI